MTKNPFVNALSATGYIVLVVSVMNFVISLTKYQKDTIIIPIAMLSLFTLSTGVMGFIFLSQPLQLYIDGKKKTAVDLFVKTLVAFGGLTLLAFALLVSGVWK